MKLIEEKTTSFDGEDEADSVGTYFPPNDDLYHKQLKEFHPGNYHTALASYYADTVIAIALALNCFALFCVHFYYGVTFKSFRNNFKKLHPTL